MGPTTRCFRIVVRTFLAIEVPFMRVHCVTLFCALASIAAFLGLTALVPNRAPASKKAEWQPLFNGKDLSGFYTWLPSTGRNKDPKGVFKVHDGMIHILDIPVTGERQEFGYIATEREYSHYRVRFQYKWGKKKFPPRDKAKRDSGILYHFVGEDRIWPMSLECQVQEGDTGDFFMVGGTQITTTVVSTEERPLRFDPMGVKWVQRGGRIVKSETVDSLTDWNTVEVVVNGAEEAVHIVNGKVVNRGWDLRRPAPDDRNKMIPLDRGRILFQAEGAEVFYRNIEIQILD